jgi:hypothetical protein
MKRSSFILSLASLLSTRWANGCAWDRDTVIAESRLKKEAGGRFDLVASIVGYFDRNPGLYYEMRLKRMDKESLSTPDNLSLFDDGGVAADRLGKSDISLQWMQRKKTRMLLQGDKVTKEDRYRYYANLGTFYAHQWIKQPQPLQDRSGLQKAIEAVNAALQVNPDGHFSREIYQMVLLDWLNDQSDDPNAPGSRWPIGRFFDMVNSMTVSLKRPHDPMSVCEGLAGLVILGAAWESPDVFILLTDGLQKAGKHGLSELASLRAQEILASGRKPFYPAMPLNVEEWRTPVRVSSEGRPTLSRTTVLSEPDKLKIRQFFEAARQAVETRQVQRNAFMMAKLEKGQHPDTNTDFWNGWTEPQMPKYPE